MAQEPLKQDLPDREELEKQKLALEVEEIQRSRTGWGRVERLLPIIITPSLGLGGGLFAFLRWLAGRRLEIITNLKREIDSENQAVRVAAARALADYPREATHLLITCLGTTRQGSTEEDRTLTNAVKDALRQIGEKAVNPLIAELRRIQGDIRSSLARDERDGDIKEFYDSFPFSIFALDLGKEDSEQELSRVAELNDLRMNDKQIKALRERLKEVKSSRYEEILSNKNSTEVLADILSTQRLKRLNLIFIDLSVSRLRGANLSGANLWMANLSGAYLFRANLSSTHLIEANLSGADLSGANLSGADLSGANLSGAYLRGANLSSANLWIANLSGAYLFKANLSSAYLEANLDRVIGFRMVKDFSKADLRGAKGLSREDLKFAKSNGAIVD